VTEPVRGCQFAYDAIVVDQGKISFSSSVSTDDVNISLISSHAQFLLLIDSPLRQLKKLFLSAAFLIFDTIQQNKVSGGDDDLLPVKVIVADPHTEWAAVEGVPSCMVSFNSLCTSLSSSFVGCLAIVFSWMMAAQCTILNYFVPNL
jgi:hypothetical protein